MRYYRALLHLYPKPFRMEYGEEMCRVYAASRPNVAAAFFEVLFNAAVVHWDILRQDLRYTMRTLTRSLGFALTAIVVVALGVGANTAVFSIADHIFLRPLPYQNPSRLVKLWENHDGYSRMELSPANYRDWKKASQAFEQMGMYDTRSINLVGQGDPERIEAGEVSSDLFPLLGRSPVIGRAFTAEDDRDGAAATVMLGDSLWRSLFAGDRSVIGRKVLLDGKPVEVIGVMPPDFHFPNREIEMWIPQQFGADIYQDRNNNFVYGIGRMKPGATLEGARAELRVIASQLEQQYPKENRRTGATLVLLQDEVSDQSKLLIKALAGAAICVLLIACANLASLLLSRALARQKELSVRMAMGAGRERLVRQLVTESLVLAALGGVLGVTIAVWSVPLLARLVPTTLPIAELPPLDFRVLSFAALITAITGIGFGILPALRVSRGADLTGLREGARSGGGRKSRLRSMLVVAEVMVSVVLLVSAGLLMRALWRIQSIEPGFHAAGVVTLRTSLPWTNYARTSVRADFYRRVLDATRRIPGVSSAAYISFLPMVMHGGVWPVGVDGDVVDRTVRNTASSRFVTPGFFATLGIPIQRGRDVEESDTMTRPFAAVVSESFVERYWPGQDPIGRHFKFGQKDRTVVGVVANIRVRGLEQTSEPQVYMPYQQVDDGWYIFYVPKDLVIHSTIAIATLMPQVRRIIHDADPQQPVTNVQTMESIVDAETASRALQVRVIAVFAGIAFLLAGIGIHGVLSFAVSQRTPEIGVRIALGASSGDILGMIFRQGILLAIAGLVPGAILAYASGKTMEALLAGVRPGDASTFGFALGLCLAMTLAGSLIPALRAVRVDPLTAMRAE